MDRKPLRILGLSFDYHDAAAALVVDGIVVAAAQEERFTRKKHDASFPINATRFCLAHGGIRSDELDYIVFYEKPLTKFDRLLMTYIRLWPRGLVSFVLAMRSLLTQKLWVEQKIRKELKYRGEVLFAEHHLSHAASAYYCSDFDDAVVVTMDGVGEWETTTVGHAQGNTLTLTKAIHFPHSLGLLYSALTYYLGFKVNSAEYKVMGLAPYGDPEKFRTQFDRLIKIYGDGSFELDTSYFGYEHTLRMTNRAFDKLFGAPPRTPEKPVTQREKDIAASLQETTERAIFAIVSHAKSLHPSKNLCLAGGVALNCVANGKILERRLFENIYIQPAAGDAGGAVGAALFVYYDVLGNPRQHGVMRDAFLGPQYSNEEIQKVLEERGVRYTRMSDTEIATKVADLIGGDTVIGWFQGRMEFGPRALGNRSIIGDARNKENWQKINLKVKFRESFRPFAPAVLAEHAKEYFDLTCESPYMLLVADVKRSDIPAVTHVDNSARVQTVDDRNGRFQELLRAFYKQTECPVIINTSFNIRGEPIVESPAQALNSFLNTHIDYLVLGNYLVSKVDNKHLVDGRALQNYMNTFELD